MRGLSDLPSRRSANGRRTWTLPVRPSLLDLPALHALNQVGFVEFSVAAFDDLVNLSVDKDHHAVGHLEELVQVGGHPERGVSRLDKAAHLVDDLSSRADVDPERWLIQEQQ